MKKDFKLPFILIAFILIFSIQSLTKADDIRDFKIEGIGIGDSLLDFLSIEEINENIDPNVYKDSDGKFKLVGIYGKFGEYEGMQFAFKTEDRKFQVHGINGGIFYSDINECNIKRKFIRRELSQMFKEAKTSFDKKSFHPADKKNKSYVIQDMFFLDKGSISVNCFNWSNEITEKYGWDDNLRVGAKSKAYNEWLGTFQ